MPPTPQPSCPYSTHSTSPPAHKAGNLLDLVILRNCSSSDPTVTPLHQSDHHLISFSLPLAPLPPSPPSTPTVMVRLSASYISTAVTSAKINYYQTKIHKSASNPHQLFSIFSSLLSTPPPPPQSSLAADDFAVFFDEKIADIRSSFTSTATLPHSPLSVPSPCFSTFSPLTDSDVSQLLLSHRPTTCALDPIPSSLLQTITPDILPFVTSLVNSSLSSGCFPSSFKLAHITPLLKKPTLDPSVIQNYRPVSLLPFLSKTIERAASNQLSSFLFLNNLLDPHQSGFRPGHSTETALLSVSARISACLRDIQSWMDNHHLKLNPGKTEMIFIPAPSSNLLDFSISLGDTMVSSSPTAKNLGVVMDNRLSLSQNITAVS
ncbi:uncharacterized protein LOC135249730 [Anguilla rostrata]|uniref:uncharacterized protein LOC135249730 n=1 Tax=Anguilla rostrata TaxID=7938 RepID=UPI0030D1AFBD